MGHSSAWAKEVQRSTCAVSAFCLSLVWLDWSSGSQSLAPLVITRVLVEFEISASKVQ